MIAFCPHCGLVFDSHMVSAIDSTNVTIRGMRDKCPRCSKNANLLEGNFNIDENGLVTILSGPPLTHDILNRLRKLAEKAKNEKYTKEQFVNEANKISPEVGNNLIKFAPKSFADILQFFGFLILLLTYLEDRKPTPAQIFNIKNETNIYNQTKKTGEVTINRPAKKKKPGSFKKRRS